jgi:hypothetical protein
VGTLAPALPGVPLPAWADVHDDETGKVCLDCGRVLRSSLKLMTQLILQRWLKGSK